MKKRLLSVLLAVTVINANIVCTYAAETDYIMINQTAGDTSGNTSQATDVTYDKLSEYIIVIPKVIQLDAATKDATYQVYVTGDLDVSKSVYAVPDNSFTMSAKGKTDILATVEQDKTEWKWNEVNSEDKVIATGKVTAADAGAGSYSGVFNFNISLSDHTHDWVEYGDEHKCSICEKEAEHTYASSEITAEPTCVDAGEITYTCECGYSYTEELNANGHTDDNVDYICDTCGESLYGLYNEYDIMTLSWDELEDQGTIAVTDGELTTGSDATTTLAGKLIMSDTVTSISSNAFKNCTSLTGVEMTENVASIGDSAFYGCSVLTDIEIPSNVTSIGKYAFQNCTSLTNIDIPDSVTSLETGAFKGCTDLVSVTLPAGITTIEDYLFDYCTSLASISIPSNVTSIGYGAFKCCSALTSLTIPSNVTTIESNAFNGCISLVSIDIPDSITSIETGAFVGCQSLVSVEIPSSITSIETGAFAYCTSLTSVIIPSNITSIGYGAFEYCSNLEDILIPNSVLSIGQKCFHNCSNLTDIYYTGSESQWNSVNKLADWDLYTNENMKVTCNYVDNGIVAGLYSEDGTMTMTWDELRDKGYVKVSDGELSTGYDWSTGVNASTDVLVGVLKIPNGISSISDWCTAYCTNLTGIVIPDSVTSIGTYAFKDCSNMSNIYFTGTEEQWEDISKGLRWNDGINSDLVITYDYTE